MHDFLGRIGGVREGESKKGSNRNGAGGVEQVLDAPRGRLAGDGSGRVVEVADGLFDDIDGLAQFGVFDDEGCREADDMLVRGFGEQAVVS